MTAHDPIEAFREAIEAADLSPPDKIVPDGRLHRFASNGERNDAAGWYVLHVDGLPAGTFGCWRAGISRTWSKKTRQEMTAAERMALRERIRAAREERDAEARRLRAQAAEKANRILTTAPLADPDHEYLKRKGIEPHGARQHKNAVAIPLVNGDGAVVGLQFIGLAGSKRFLTGTPKRGAFHMIGEPGDVIVIAEGFATAASLHEVTGHAVVVALDAGNLKPVAETLARKYPEAQFIVAGDNDESGIGQTKARETAQSIGAAVVIPPTVSDFNDLHQAEGPDAVSSVIFEALADAGRDHVHDQGVDDHATVNRLAKLSPLEYDRKREAEAEKLGVRASTLDKMVKSARSEASEESGSGHAVTLDDPEPWPHEVAGDDLLESLVSVIERHVVLPQGAPEAVALWIMHAHAHDTAAISPILAVTSPTPECGKTTLLTLLGALLPRPLEASNITAAALFRAVEKWRPCLLIDEADTFLRDSDDLRGVLNSGHNRAAAWVIRTTGDDHEPRQFRTWGPKAIALIGKLPATLASRSIHAELRRLAENETVEPLRADRLGHLGPLRRKAWRWAQDHGDLLRDADPEIPAALRGRTTDNWRHLFAIADLAGGDWPMKARTAAETLSAGRSEQSAGIMLLEDIRAIFTDLNVEKVSSSDLAIELVKMESRPWPEWKAGKPLTVRQLAKLLEPFGIGPRNLRFEDRTGIKGYRHIDFKDAFARYLPEQSATPLHSQKTALFSDAQSATGDDGVADSGGSETAENSQCSGVADENPETWVGEV